MEIVGAVKLMDGLFLGDAICAEVITQTLKLMNALKGRTWSSSGATRSLTY